MSHLFYHGGSIGPICSYLDAYGPDQEFVKQVKFYLLMGAPGEKNPRKSVLATYPDIVCA